MPETDLDLLRRAANLSGEIALKHFGNGPESWDKGGGQGPVTEADLEIDSMLRDLLGTARPDYGWLSEETEDDALRLQKETIFIVDPIDGTRSFMNGHANFSHALAIATNGQVTAAVVHLPIKERTYYAALGQGAFCNDMPITGPQKTDTCPRILASGSQFKPALWPKGFPAVERHFRSSLAYRVCLVAEGRFDGMLTMHNTWDWDVAAGCLIASEAGVKVTQKTGASPLFNKEAPCQTGLLVAHPDTHDYVSEYL